MRNLDPREIIARFDSTCAETGKTIRKGERCIYYPNGKRVFHTDSKAAADFRAWQFDISMCGADY